MRLITAYIRNSITESDKITKTIKKDCEKINSATAILGIVLLLTTATSLVALPITTAHTPSWTIPTWCYAAVTNPTIGVNQQAGIIFWSSSIPPTAQGAYGDRWTFTIKVTKPDGTLETLGPIKSDPVGGGYASFTPQQVGNYTIVVKLAELKITGQPLNPDLAESQQTGYVSWGDVYQASDSEPIAVVAQNSPIQPWSETPLPNQFWTRPINSANRIWSKLAANWLSGAAQQNGPTLRYGYGTAPESAHVMWATPMWAGGIMDARYGDTGYQTIHYEGLGFTPPIVLNGKIYYNTLSLPREGWQCLDLYTGKIDYFHNTTGPATTATAGSSGSIPQQSLSFGQIYNYDSPNQHGGMPYLWSTSAPTPNTWMMFDAYTGNYICSIANVSAAGTAVYGKDGSILRYNIVGSGANQRLTVWNTSRAIWWKPSWQSNEYWMWRPGLNVTYNGNNGFSLNVSAPGVTGNIRAVREDQFVIGGTQGSNNEDGLVKGTLWALNLNPSKGALGSLLWRIDFTPPSSAGNKTIAMGTVDPEDGIFLFTCKQTRQWYGYNLATGQQQWGPTESEPAFHFYSMNSFIYNGMLFSIGDGMAAGIMHAYNITTGHLLWEFVPQQVGFESPYGNYPISISCIVDGKIYTSSGEHSPTQPLWRGSYLRCINASNGEELWKILHWGVQQTMGTEQGMIFPADGFLVGLNIYDMRIYCYGKGPSATTVAASPKTPAQGNKILFEGTVTDVSVGAKKLVEETKFNSIAAIADKDQQAWMEYIYMQQSKPADAEGVKVHLTAVDPNKNFQDIGYATSDDLGYYAISWKPPVPGLYKVTATFEGSASYYGSEAVTSFEVLEAASVNPAVTPTPAQTATPAVPTPTAVQTPVLPSPTQAVNPPTSAEPTTTYIAIGAAVIIIVAAAAALILRRRK